MRAGGGFWYTGREFGEQQRMALQRVATVAQRVSLARMIEAGSLNLMPITRSEHDLSIDGSMMWAYGGVDAYRNFFESQELRRVYCGRRSGNVITVRHKDDECIASEVATGRGTIRFLNGPSHSFPKTSDAQEISLNTDVRDLDVIKGGDRKLEQVLDSIDGQLKPSLVVLESACISLVTGDDLEGPAYRLEKKLRVPVFPIGNNEDPNMKLFSYVKNLPTFRTVEKRAGSYNLVGVPRIKGLQEVESLLAEAGASLNSWLLPEINTDTIGSYMAAEVQILYPCSRTEGSYRGLLSDIDMPRIEMTPPCGIEGTKTCLYEIAGALGLEERMGEILEARLATILPKWEALKAEAKDYRLGFVVDDTTIKRLRNPRELLGIPLIIMLREMGFSLEFLRFARPGVACPDDQVLQDGEVKIRWFSDEKSLQRCLQTSDSVAFYSEFFYDRRLTRNGKAVFSLRQIEMGFDGALASLKALLAVCKMSFYRSYGHKVGAAFGSLVMEPSL